MSDSKKLKIIDELIGFYYEYFGFDSAAEKLGAAEMLVGCISTILEAEGIEECDSCSGRCHGCSE